MPVFLERINLIRRLVSGLFALIAGSYSVMGQQIEGSGGEIPTGALLKPPADSSKWTVTYEYPKTQNQAAVGRTGAPVQITTIKTGNILSEDIVDGKGLHQEYWYIGTTQYRKPAGTSEWFESSPANGNYTVNSDYMSLPANGYRGWEWVGEDSYLGTTTLDVGPCLVFVPGGKKSAKLSGGSLSKEQIAALPVMALVNAESRLPVAMRSGGVTQRFVFSTPPSGKQQLPSDLAEVLRKSEETKKRLNEPPPRPY